MTERWLPIPGYVGFYEVSDHGHVRSVDRVVMRNNGRPQRWRSRGMSIAEDSVGRPVINLRRDGESKYHLVHRLVLEAFVGPCPDGMEACHANDIKTDNQLKNLRWDTSSANTYDMVRNGNHPQARKTHCKRGHEFTAENTLRDKNGFRQCGECRRVTNTENMRRWRMNKKQQETSKGL